ncbi:MAG: asparagine synthase (glutamine-hydrolyzing) [Lysobacter sp.]|nr:asparagine synthase (glutamine-hydrolyzing) [Lysobacter sp.]
MCGIAGLATLDGGALPPGAFADAMCRRIVHRGPDDQGVREERDAQIGMRRLSIIDLAGGHQPIHNEDRTVWVVFNGEIYNFPELRRDLEDRGHAFYTNTDTECIVHAYEEYGDEAFSKLRGMFAIAILDRARGRLVLARDRLGKKPLYYTRTREGLLAFASETKCLFEVPGFRPQASAAATREYFTLGYVPGPGSIFEDVHKLPPAHYLVMERGNVTVHRYWRLAFGPKWEDGDEELRQRLSGLLDEAVRIRLASDVPFGAFLSGGLDSSVVAALMARHLARPVKTFTIGFREAAFDETPDARRIAAHIGAEPHELVMTPDAVSLVPLLAWHFDEPFGDSSSIPTYLVSRLAASHVKMVLSGDGGDEAFAGYERYVKYMRLNAMARASLGLAGPALRLAGGALGGRLGNRLRRIGARAGLPYPERYLSAVALGTDAEVSPLLAPDLAAVDPYRSVRGHFGREDVPGDMDRILSGDMDTYLADDILVKVDRATMANSLEARAPLLDHVLLEFCARLPFRLKNDGREGKVILREVARQWLPAESLAKRKQGFGIPLDRWFRHDLKPLMLDLLGDRSFRERGVFDERGVRACLDSHLSGQRDFGELLWLVLTYEMWARAHLDGRGAPPAGGPSR